MSTLPRPLALTDSQYLAVVEACDPLLPVDRSAFLVALANVLRGEQQPLGDGQVARAIRSLQGRYFRPPTVKNGASDTRRNVGPPLE